MDTKPRDTLYCGVNRKHIKKATPTLNEENMGYLLEFISERYKIHIRKDIKGLPAPWTNNPVLQQYKFTNVFREDDRVSRTLIELVSTNPELSLKEKILNTFLLRSWNNPKTFTDFGGPWTAKEIYDGLTLKEKVRPIYHRLLEENPDRKWYGSAYNQGGFKKGIRFPDAETVRGNTGEPDIPLRVFHIGPWLKEKNIVHRLLNAEDQQEAYEVIHDIKGFKDFLAYQVFIDLTYIKNFPFSENEFVVAGPGCKFGLDILFEDFDGLTYEEALFYLRDNIDEYFSSLITVAFYERHPYTWDPERLFLYRQDGDRCLNLMSIENCCCEVSKYIRVITGTGRPRNRYTPSVK